MNSHKELIVWQKSMSLVMRIYALTKEFPEYEQFNLTSQLRRCVVSLPSNIAEGYGRKTKKEFVRFLKISYGSSSELETQVEISYRLDFISETEYNEVVLLITEVRKMLNKLISSISLPLTH